MDRVAIFIVNYNMPERTNALHEYIRDHSGWPHDTYIIDNGSDKTPPSKYTNVWIYKNEQTTAGWLRGLIEAKETREYFAYLFMITSADFPETGDPITPLARLLQERENAVAIHPALTLDSTTSWTHMITRGDNNPRQTWFIDNICAMYRADWFDSIGWFDPEMLYAWGIDLETCYKARQQGRSIWIHEGVKVRKITNIGYKMDRMNMQADERSLKAGANMRQVLTKKYGDNFWDKMVNENVRSEWR
jgi:hypothetical protein